MSSSVRSSNCFCARVAAHCAQIDQSGEQTPEAETHQPIDQEAQTEAVPQMVCPQINATAIAGKQPEPPAAAFTALAIPELTARPVCPSRTGPRCFQWNCQRLKLKPERPPGRVVPLSDARSLLRSGARLEVPGPRSKEAARPCAVLGLRPGWTLSDSISGLAVSHLHQDSEEPLGSLRFEFAVRPCACTRAVRASARPILPTRRRRVGAPPPNRCVHVEQFASAPAAPGAVWP